MKDRLTTAPLPLERPQCSSRPWNAPWRICNRLQPLEQPQGFWNARSATGTALGLWNARRAILYCSLAGDTISVLIRSALRRSAPWNARSAIGTPSGLWNRALALPGTPSGLLERPQGVSK